MSELKMTQLVAAQWQGRRGITHTLYGLSTDGQMYRYLHRKGGWVAYSMKVVTDPNQPLYEEEF